MKKQDSVAVICCIEQGELEYKGLCMILSLRRNWGSWSDVPIYAYSPRAENHISSWLREIYKEYKVYLIDEPINKNFIEYPLANKPLSMAHAEKHMSENLLIFLDSDILCWNEPHLFALPDEKDLGMVIDGTKTVASYGASDTKHEPMWKSLYKIAHVENSEPYVTTLLTDEIVRGWWSSGVIACRRSANLMEKWLAVFEESKASNIFIPEAGYLSEQMTICAVVASVYDRFIELPVSYNYPVQNFRHYSARGTNPNVAVLWHYQPYLNKSFRKLRKRIDSTQDISTKIRIANKFITDIKTKFPRMIGLDESIFSLYRRKLGIGPRVRKLIGCSKDTDPIV